MKINIQNKFKRVFAFLKFNTQKRVLPLLVAFLIVIYCVAFAYVPVSAASTVGFLTDTKTNENANAYWKQVDIYTLLNSASSGVVLTTHIGSYYYGLVIRTYSTVTSTFPVIMACKVTSIAPYTSATYPLGTVVDHSNTPDEDVYIFRNYEEAYSVWLNQGIACYYLLPDSYLKIPTDASYVKSSGKLCALGQIAADGVVTMGLTRSMSNEWFGNSTSTTGYSYGLYSEYSPVFSFPEAPILSLSTTATNSLYPGMTRQYTAAVSGDVTDPSVNWSVSGAVSATTAIDENGLLSVGPDEVAETLTIAATLNEDTSVVGSMDVTIVPLPTTDELTILPAKEEFNAGQAYSIQYYLAFSDGTIFEHPALYWDVVGDLNYYSISEDGLLSIPADTPVGGAFIRAGFTFADVMLQVTYLHVVANETGSSGSSGETSGGTDNTETNEKLDDIISGGEAGEQLGGTTDEMDNKNEELGGVMDEYENAQSQMPTTPNDVSGLVNMDDFNAAVDTLALVLKWDEMGITGMYIPMAMVLGVSALCYIVFGKKR